MRYPDELVLYIGVPVPDELSLDGGPPLDSHEYSAFLSDRGKRSGYRLHSTHKVMSEQK